MNREKSEVNAIPAVRNIDDMLIEEFKVGCCVWTVPLLCDKSLDEMKDSEGRIFHNRVSGVSGEWRVGKNLLKACL